LKVELAGSGAAGLELQLQAALKNKVQILGSTHWLI
jgi:hypothetical protein